MTKKITYSEKLKDSRWQQRRLQLLNTAQWKCQSPFCQNSNPNATLQVHHKLYLRGSEPWDYEDWALQVLCDECHETAQKTMENANRFIALSNLAGPIAVMGDADLDEKDYFEAIMACMTFKSSLRKPLLIALNQVCQSHFAAFCVGTGTK